MPNKKLITAKIDAQFQAHSVSVPPDATGISFTSVKDSLVTFDNSTTFGTQSVQVPNGHPTELDFVQRGETKFTVSGNESRGKDDDAESFVLTDNVTYDIIFES